MAIEKFGGKARLQPIVEVAPQLKKSFNMMDSRIHELQKLQLIDETLLSQSQLQTEAMRLHHLVETQQQQILLLEEQVSGEARQRAKQVFDLIDVNGDGRLQYREFQEAAPKLILTFAAVSESKFNKTLSALFKAADTNSDGELDFDEFVTMLSKLRAESLDPLREARVQGLGQLLDVTLQMTSHNLMAELETRLSDGSARTPLHALESCVERWCTLHQNASAAIDGLFIGSDGEQLLSRETELEGLLAQVGGLAVDLSLPNVTGSVQWSLRRSTRQFVRGLASSLSFCWRGLSILASDISQSAVLLYKLWNTKKLEDQEVKLIKRTAVDLVAMIPYSIIMIIPLSPPGHVFAFGLLNRCFPSAVPSPFTRQRQDINEIYSTIAFEVASQSTGIRAWQQTFTRTLASRWRKFLRRTGLRRSAARSGTAPAQPEGFISSSV